MLACLHMTTTVLNPRRRVTRLRQGLECSARLKLDGGASGRINRLGGHKVCPPAKLLIAIAPLNMGGAPSHPSLGFAGLPNKGCICTGRADIILLDPQLLAGVGNGKEQAPPGPC